MKKLDLPKIVYYYYQYAGLQLPCQFQKISKDPETMKTALRIFALTVVLAGAAAASVTPSKAHNFVSHQAATASNPIPVCAPGLPGCPGR